MPREQLVSETFWFEHSFPKMVRLNCDIQKNYNKPILVQFLLVNLIKVSIFLFNLNSLNQISRKRLFELLPTTDISRTNKLAMVTPNANAHMSIIVLSPSNIFWHILKRFAVNTAQGNKFFFKKNQTIHFYLKVFQFLIWPVHKIEFNLNYSKQTIKSHSFWLEEKTNFKTISWIVCGWLD